MADRTPQPRSKTASADGTQDLLLLGVVCLLVVAVYAASSKSGVLEILGGRADQSYYNLLTQGFRNGHLNLKKDLPPDLAAAANAVNAKEDLDSRLRDMNWIRTSRLHDLSYYRGKLYLYFGATPVVLLFWPYALITGHYLLHRYAVAVFFSAGFLISAGLLWTIWRRYFPQVAIWVAAAGILGLGLADFIPMILRHSDMYEVAISCGDALVMLSLAGVWLALHRPEQRRRWLAAASLAYGLAVGARPSLLPGAIMLLVPVLMAWRKSDASDPSTLDCADMSAPSKRRHARPAPAAGSAALQIRRSAPLTLRDPRLLLAAFGPIALIGFGLLLYNYLRFDNAFEFGQNYQLPITPHHQFSWSFFWFNLKICALRPAHWQAGFPFIYDVAPPPVPRDYFTVEPYTFGVLPAIPVAVLAIPLAWRRWAACPPTLVWFLAATSALCIGCALPLLIHDSMSVRYEVEFAHALLLLAIVGIFALEEATASRPGLRRVARCGWCSLLAYSLAFNVLASIGRSSNIHYNIATALRYDGQVEAAIGEYRRALQIQPRFAEAEHNLGSALLSLGRLEEAEIHFQRALEMQPGNSASLNNLGYTLLKQGKPGQAVELFKRALVSQPDFAQAQNNLGLALFQMGRFSEAEAHFRLALNIQPDDADARNSLAAFLLKMGRIEEAIPQYRRLIELKPRLSEPHDMLASALVRAGRISEAIPQFQAVSKLQPQNAMARNNLAWILATCPENSLRNGTNAVSLAREAVELSGGANPAFLGTLAAACAETGRMPEAVATAQAAERLAQDQKNSAALDSIRAQLKCYQAGSPFRDANLTNATPAR